MATTPPHHRLVPSVSSRHGSPGLWSETSALHGSSQSPCRPHVCRAGHLQSGQGAACTAASSRTMSDTRRPTRPASTLRAANTVTSAPLPSARIVKVKAATDSNTRTLASTYCHCSTLVNRHQVGHRQVQGHHCHAQRSARRGAAPPASLAGNAFAGMLYNFAELFAQSLLDAGAHVQDRLHDAAAPTTTSAVAGGVVAGPAAAAPLQERLRLQVHRS